MVASSMMRIQHFVAIMIMTSSRQLKCVAPVNAVMMGVNTQMLILRDKIVQLTQQILLVVAYTTMVTLLQAKCAVHVKMIIVQMYTVLIQGTRHVKDMQLIQAFVVHMTMKILSLLQCVVLVNNIAAIVQMMKMLVNNIAAIVQMMKIMKINL